jgi:hypothetical protein
VRMRARSLCDPAQVVAALFGEIAFECARHLAPCVSRAEHFLHLHSADPSIKL